MDNLYKILGVNQSATDAEIKQAYRQKAKLLHPDHNNNNQTAADKLIIVNQAYAVLSNRAEKANYDASLRVQAQAQQRQNQQRQAPNSQQQAYAQQGQQYGGGQQINIEQMTANAYNQGYAKGYSDSTARTNEKDSKTNQQMKIMSDRLRNAEATNIKNNRIIAELEDRVGELEAENSTLWIQVGESSESANSSNNDEYRKIIDNLNSKLKDANDEKARIEEKSGILKNVIFEKELEINKLTEELSATHDQLESYETYFNSKENDENMDTLIHERDEKMKQVKKMIKNTYYGTLGVVYWTENDEIFANYNKLKTRYKNKLAKGDFRANIKLQEIENAYNTLIDSKARKSYNKTIDITEEDIRQEKIEEEEFKSAVEKYNTGKEEEEFWKYVDDLMFQAQTGEADAQNTLGEMYVFGDEIEQDYDQAFYWFKEAAKQQHADGLLNLGKCYLKGEGTLRNEEKGIGFIKQAAKLGSQEALKFTGGKR